MPFYNTLAEKQVSDYFDSLYNKIEKEVINIFIEVGEKCLKAMEADRGYNNVSFNLSDSRGYIVVKDRLIIHSSTFKGTMGGQTGYRLAKERSLRIDGVGLVIVAGMSYAEELEANGKQVYTSGYLKAEQLIPKMLKKLGFK